MKKILASLAVLAMVLMPSPAFAWFGWLDQMSGPGPWFGALFDFRVKCFGPRANVNVLRSAIEAARRVQATASPESVRVLGDALLRVVDAAKTDQNFRLFLHPQDLNALTVLSLPGGLSPGVSAAAGQPTVGELQAAATQLIAVLQPAYDHAKSQRDRALGTGVIVETCGDVVRRSSIDLSADIWLATTRKREFANNEGVQLYTFRVSYSYAFVRNPRFNIIDGSVGAGLFVFRSQGFDNDDGFRNQRRNIFVEPIRLYLHAPLDWSEDNAAWWKQVLAVPVISGAATLFPRGFDENAFGQNPAIGPELVPSFSVYVNAKTLFRR